MTPFKNFSEHTTWKNRIRRGGLYVAVSVMLSAQVGCGSDDNGGDWEQVTTYQPSKGVITTIEEGANGEFSIIDEQVVGNVADSRVIIRKLDGKTDTLTLAQARGLVQAQDTTGTQNTTTNNHHYHRPGLGGALWWGSMGYLMGRSFSSPVQQSYYREDARRSSSGSGFYGGGYRSGSAVSQELRSTATPQTQMRPARSRTGFFKGWGSSSRG